MRKWILQLVVAGATLLTASVGFAQTSWYYYHPIKFPVADTSRVRPYALTVDGAGNLWVISSTATDTSAHNSVWRAAPNDTLFTKVVDFGSLFDTSSTPYLDPYVGVLRGISALGNDIYLSGTQPPSTHPATLVGFIYVLRGGNINDSLHFGYGMRGGGYGTIIDAIAMANDSIAFVGCPYDPSKLGPSFRCYNFTGGPLTAYDKAGNPSQRPVGAFLLGDPNTAYSAYYSPAPGGPVNSSTGYDQIRSIALVPGMNYGDSAWAKSSSYFYTSRTGDPALSTSNGNIAVWRGGYDKQPSLYAASQISDVAGYLSLGTSTYYGIAADSSGNLYLCRPDSGFGWVKVFNVAGTFATEIASFPSKNDLVNPDPNGAPMVAPMAIALSRKGDSAYVIDPVLRTVFVFGTTPVTSIKDDLSNRSREFDLSQNYPNPFNPSTVIRYTIPRTGLVSLKVYNVLAQEVATLVNEIQRAGTYEITFNASELASGVYFYRIQSGNFVDVKKMLLVK
ncbi:MAG: T9SS type A sorting domain-containing protein [Bacteroidota bacterium]